MLAAQAAQALAPVHPPPARKGSGGKARVAPSGVQSTARKLSAAAVLESTVTAAASAPSAAAALAVRQTSSSSKLRSAVDAARKGSTENGDGAKKLGALVAAPSSSAVSKWQQAAKQAVQAEPKKKYGQSAFDMAGKEHDLTELRERRNAAVSKGLRKMYKFFKQKDFAPLYDIGDDAPSIFFECWYTSANSSIRMESKAMCKKLLPKYETRLLEECNYEFPPPTAIELAALAARGKPKPASSSGGGTSGGKLKEAAGAIAAASAFASLVGQKRGTRMRITQVIADAGSSSSAGGGGGGSGGSSRRVSKEVLGHRSRPSSQAGSQQGSQPASRASSAGVVRQPSAAAASLSVLDDHGGRVLMELADGQRARLAAKAKDGGGGGGNGGAGNGGAGNGGAGNDGAGSSGEEVEPLTAAVVDAAVVVDDEESEVLNAVEAALEAEVEEEDEDESEEGVARKAAAAARRGIEKRRALEAEAEEKALGDAEELDGDGDGAEAKAGGKSKKKPKKAGGGKGAAVRGVEKGRPNRPDREDFFALMFLARCKHEMGDETDALLERADAAWKVSHPHNGL